jgi:broad specificity phosphatase PhoE
VDFKDLPEVRAQLKPTLILVRHGSTEFDGEGDKNLIQGWKPGGLTALGQKESHGIQKTLECFPIRKLYSSDLPRAVETANIVAHYTTGGSAPISVRYGLRCWHMGSLEGDSKNKWLEFIEEMQTKAKDTNMPRGESFNTFKTRFLTQLKALLAQASESPEQGFIVAVTHSDALRLTHAWVAGGADREYIDNPTLTGAMKSHVKPGEAMVLTPFRDAYKISYLKGWRKS